MTTLFVALCLLQMVRFSQIWFALTSQLHAEYRHNRMKSGLRWTKDAGRTRRTA